MSETLQELEGIELKFKGYQKVKASLLENTRDEAKWELAELGSG